MGNSPTPPLAKRQGAKVIVPLYIYPISDQTWGPLHKAISAHPSLNFLIVVNPNSGPGDTSLPSHDYMRELPKLNAHINVTTVGYVLIDYCRRPLEDVRRDINLYAGWAAENATTGLGIEGIFLDETPNHFSPERAEYLQAVQQHIKATSGILGDRLVIHNPGTPPDAALIPPLPVGPDVVITCEEPYDRYREDEVQQRLQEYPCNWARAGYMISAVPDGEIATFVGQLCHRGAYLFVTDLVENFYESFGRSWTEFVAATEVT
ncbi:Spherulation-specific family 4 [Leptodontidium sp. 2 PMI_412]|nr:Spherulation-specific family 4 [Leptodontidium sp. 2 PMI_412]